MDRLGNIEAFVTAAELGSFTRAARRLGLSASAVSRRISQLEEAVGLRLMHRTTRAVGLSDEGRAYFDRARNALRELAEAHELAAHSRDRPAGLLKIEAPTILGRAIVVPAVTRFVRRYPAVEVVLALRDTVSDSFADGIDVALRMGPQPDSGLISRRLGTTWMRMYGARAYLKRKGTPRSLEALMRHERVAYSSQGRVIPWRLRDATTVREIAPGRRVVVNTGDALIDVGVAGVGLVWMCEFMRASRSGGLVEVLADTACTSSPIYAMSLPTRQMLPKVRQFIELVESELAEQGVQVSAV